MGVERIHACPNHCILYRGDAFKDLKNAMYVPLVGTKNNTGYCVDDNEGPTSANKGKGNMAKNNSAASIETDDTTLGISEK